MNLKNDERVDLVRQMIDAEMQKKHPDMGFVNECLAALREWDTDMIKLTSEEVALRYEKLSASLEAKKKGNSAPAVRRKQSMPLWKRAILVAVAVLLVTALSLTVVAATTDGPFSDWIKTVLGAKPGEEIIIDGVTYVKGSDTRLYKTVEEAWKAEGIDLFYPTVLPEGVKVEEINVTDIRGETVYTFVFNVNSVSYALRPGNEDDHHFTNYTCLEINGRRFYYIHRIDAFTGLPFHAAILFYNGYEYHVNVPTYDDLIAFISNLKEV